MMYKKQTNSCFYIIFFPHLGGLLEPSRNRLKELFSGLKSELKMCYAANLDVSKHNGQKQTGLQFGDFF